MIKVNGSHCYVALAGAVGGGPLTTDRLPGDTQATLPQRRAKALPGESMARRPFVSSG